MVNGSDSPSDPKRLLAMANPWLQLGVLVLIGIWVGKISSSVESLDERVGRLEAVLYTFLSPPR